MWLQIGVSKCTPRLKAVVSQYTLKYWKSRPLLNGCWSRLAFEVREIAGGDKMGVLGTKRKRRLAASSDFGLWYPAQSRFRFRHLMQAGFVSSHFTRRFLLASDIFVCSTDVRDWTNLQVMHPVLTFDPSPLLLDSLRSISNFWGALQKLISRHFKRWFAFDGRKLGVKDWRQDEYKQQNSAVLRGVWPRSGITHF